MTRRARSSDGGGRANGPLRLPPSGLASEILAALKAGTLTGDGPEPAAPPPPVPSRLAPAAARGPERLYAFADLLERESAGGGEEEREEPETWVTFALAGEVYGMPVSNVQEILRVGTVTRVPRAPRPVRGITNLRGRVLVVLDTRVRLGLKRAETDARSRILVVESRGRQIGLLVDAVLQVVRLLRSKVEPPPGEVMTAGSAYVTGVYQLDLGAKAFAPGSDQPQERFPSRDQRDGLLGRLLILLDPDRLLLLDSAAAAEAAPPSPPAAAPPLAAGRRP
jgi:purine-binding chemotaxis protein CheW